MDLSNLGSNKTGDPVAAEPAFPWCRQRNWTYWLVLKSRRRKAGIPPHDPKFQKNSACGGLPLPKSMHSSSPNLNALLVDVHRLHYFLELCAVAI